MTKPLAAVFAMLALLLLHSNSTAAQIYFPRLPYPHPYPLPARPDPNPDSSPIELAGYLALGGGSAHIGTAGLYGRWNHAGFCPGLDLRIQGNQYDLHGMLVGPHLAYKPSGSLHALHPYIEALFGPNEDQSNLYPGSYRGVTSAAVIGLDGDLSPHFRFRLIEFSKESFSGLSGVHPYTITIGIVLHLP